MPWKPLPPPARDPQVTPCKRERRSRFLVDENVDAVAAQFIAAQHFNVVAVAQCELAGASDDVVL